MPGRVLILDNIDFIRGNFDKIREIVDRDPLPVIPLSDAVFLFLKSRGLDCINYHRFEYRGMYSDLYTTTKIWGQNWYRPRGKDISIAGRSSLGSVIEWSMIYFFSHVLKLYLSTSEIIKNLKPKEVVVITSENPPVAHEPVTSESINTLEYSDVGLLPHIVNKSIQALGSPAEIKIVNLPYPYERGKSSKAKVTDFFRFFLSPLNQAFSRLYRTYNSAFKKRKRLLFFEGFHHFFATMRSPHLRSCDRIHLQKVIGPSLFLKLYKNGIRSLDLRQDRRPIGTAGNVTFDLEKIKKELSDFFIYRRENMLSCIWPRLEIIFKKYFSRVYKDSALMAGVIKENSPHCIVVENDKTYYDKILVDAAKKMGIYTVIIQHGLSLTGASYGNDKLVIHNFYPVTADRIFCFGEVFKDWFIKMDVDEKRVSVTGAARFDSYYRNNGRRAVDSLSRRKTVLIVLNDTWLTEGVVTHHIRLNIFYKHMCTFMALAKDNPEVRFVVRPHDPQHLWGEIFGEALESLDNFIISRREPIKELLSYVEVVIGYTSTILLEALICRIPIISLDTGEYYNYHPFWRYGLSRRVRSLKDLNATLQGLLYNNQEKEMVLKSIDKNLHLFNYGNDGLASQRAAEELDRILSEVEIR